MKHMTTTAAERSVTKSEGEPNSRGNRATRVPEILEISTNSFASEGYAAFNQRRVASGSWIRLSLLRATVETMAECYLEMYRKQSKDNLLAPMSRLDRIVDETFAALTKQDSNLSAFAIELWSLAEHEDFARDLLEEMIGQNQEIFAGLVSRINPRLSSEDCGQRGALLTSHLQGLLVFVRQAGKNTPDLNALRAITKVVWKALSTAPQ